MNNVKDIFNDMADKYDNLSDLWYSWLFSRLHYFIASNILNKGYPMKTLDIGCGTGFQSFLYAGAGSTVHGIDLADELIIQAKSKIKNFNPEELTLFPEYFDYVRRYNLLIRNCIKNNESKGEYQPPKFFIGNALDINYNDEEFDHVNCCGSTLSFIPDYEKAISEIARVLKPKGTFFIEVENRWSFFVFWYLLDPILKGKLNVNKDYSSVFKFLKRKPTRNIWINFLFDENDKPVKMNLNLFTSYSLKRDLMRYGLKVEKKWYINSITSLIPSTLLDCPKPSKRLINSFKFLAMLEEKLLLKVPGSSLVLYGRKI